MRVPIQCVRGCPTLLTFPRIIGYAISNLQFGPVDGITQCLSCNFNACIDIRLPSSTSTALLPPLGSVDWYRWGIISHSQLVIEADRTLVLRLGERVVCSFPTALGNHMRDSMRARVACVFPAWSTALSSQGTALSPSGLSWNYNE